MSAHPAVLEAHGVAKRFATPHGPVEVLREVSLAIEPGEFVALTGPSGSGKSTFLHLAALLDQPSAGRMLFEGKDLSVCPEPERCAVRKKSIGMVFQQFFLLPHRSAFDNVLFRFRYVEQGEEDAARCSRQALESMGLSRIAHQPARVLSGGEMQRVAIARAVALRPKLLVADEPTGNLDRAAAEVVMDCFRRLHEEGMTILLVTHNEALLPYCTRRLHSANGTIRERAA